MPGARGPCSRGPLDFAHVPLLYATAARRFRPWFTRDVSGPGPGHRADYKSLFIFTALLGRDAGRVAKVARLHCIWTLDRPLDKLFAVGLCVAVQVGRRLAYRRTRTALDSWDGIRRALELATCPGDWNGQHLPPPLCKLCYLPGRPIYWVRLHLAYTFHLDAHVLVCRYLQPIRLVDCKSLRKSICRVRRFSSRFLKQFTD